MNRYAILNLQAPLISFGSEAVDSRRPTSLFPGRSMLTGLISNALGWRRQDHDKLQRLQDRIRYAVRIEHHQDAVMRDFQTVSLAKSDQAWTTAGAPETRAGSVQTYQGPEIRLVEYIIEARAVVALRLECPQEYPTLDDVGQALRWPARPLHIGRKSCMPETMIFTEYVEAATATGALLQQPAPPEVKHIIQWNLGEGDPAIEQTRERWTSDRRDWANGVHVGRELVYQGKYHPNGEEQ